MRWGGSRLHERFTFRRVVWPSMAESEDIWQITGGSASLGAFTDLKASGTISYKGTSVPDDGDLIRVYYSFEDVLGESVMRAICTCFVKLGDDTHYGTFVEGKADLKSTLTVLSDDGPGRPYSVAAGSNPVSIAAAIARSLDLRVSATTSTYVLSAQHLFDPDVKWLEIVNWLLDAAGYSSVYPDSMGTLQMHPYIEPTKREPSWWFRNDGKSALKRGITHSDNRAGVPNAVRLWYEDDSCGLYAEAINIDKRSTASTSVLGRTTSIREEIEELAGNTASAKLESLEAATKKKLVDNSTRIEYMEIPCMYVPIEPNDCVGLNETDSGIEFIGGVTSIDVDFAIGAPTMVKARKLLRPDFEVSVTGKVVWSV